MDEYVVSNGQTQRLVPLRIRPYSHQEVPTVTGNAFSAEAGTVLYGHYNMEYLLPQGDRLRLIANHNQKTVQLLLFTHNPEILQRLPGQRVSSLVADVINRIHRYQLRSNSYTQPLTTAQEKKRYIAKSCISSLQHLLKKERALKPFDYLGQEKLRRKIIGLVEKARDQNRLLAIEPTVSEGTLGHILYDCHQAAERYQFNRHYAVSSQDQMDFKDSSTHRGKANPCFVWDSEIHIGHNNSDLDDALRVICEAYQLKPAQALSQIPANRFTRLKTFLYQLWLDAKDWGNYLSSAVKPNHQTTTHERADGISITHISPYYKLVGVPQKAYASLNELVLQLRKDAKAEDGQPHYFVQDGAFYPLPDGDDLYRLSQISKRHLYLPERIGLRLNAFISRIPSFFQHFYSRLSRFIAHDLQEEFQHHVHLGHQQPSQTNEKPVQPTLISSLHAALEQHGLLKNGQTLEEFVEEHLQKSPYIIARANHPPSPHAFDNPVHRVINVLRHFASFFVDTSERNPLVGSLAMAAYFYGAGAVLAPQALESLLTKLHLKGLIAGIEPVQRLGHWMSHGRISETISASITLWQGALTSGNLDKFFVNAVRALQEDPAEIAIIISLALSFGYGLTKVFPALGREMGEFPFTNYATLGAKSGAAIYDTIMHPGDDWLLGTCKWFCKGVINLGKLIIAPFVESYHYGFYEGFINGWKKSAWLFLRLSQQFLVASLDLGLILLSIPFTEVSAMLLHVPFRGITHFISKSLGTLGNLSNLGEYLQSFTLGYPIGCALVYWGSFWDKSVGRIFYLSAIAFTMLCNEIDEKAGEFKQWVLSGLTMLRNGLYQWAFYEEDALMHTILTEQDYYTSHPTRCGKIMHSSSHSMLQQLLEANNEHAEPNRPESYYYVDLFSPVPEPGNFLSTTSFPSP